MRLMEYPCIDKFSLCMITTFVYQLTSAIPLINSCFLPYEKKSYHYKVTMKLKVLILTILSIISVNLYASENEEINPGGGEFGFLGYTSADRQSIEFIYNFGPVFAERIGC